MKDTKHIVYLDETKMDRRHTGYLLASIAIGVSVTLLVWGGLFGLAVLLKLIFA